jgi:PEP-CTERM motif
MTTKMFSFSASAKRVFSLGVLVAGLVSFGLCSNALATSLTVANANLATQGAGPYGEVTITATDSTNKSFKVTATRDGSFVFGDHEILDLNIAAAAGTLTLDTTSCTFTGTTSSTTCSQEAAGTVDGFGTFNLQVSDGPGFSSGGYTSLSFTFTTQNAVTLANLLALNSSGADVAAHMALSTNTACTGFAANGGSSSSGVDNSACTSTTAREPGTLMLLGSGLLGFAFVFKRRVLSFNS